MALTVYDSKTRKKQIFEPITPGKVNMYVCGVTVYDDAHVGHARCYVAFDAIHRHFLARGYQVEYVRNFTDVDDKIIKRAQEMGISTQEVAQRYMDSFSQDMEALGVLLATREPQATEHIPEIIKAVQTLIDKGHAYEIEGDVYFSVQSFPGYGQLSGRNLEDMQAGARVEVDSRKQNPLDFALWKASKPGEPSWPSPWGAGRPGWHIECSAMSQKYFGPTFDIHGGGKDLLFPHHENELAQAEAITGQPFARYWIHNGFVQVNQEKMSKSLGNFFTIKDILKTTHPEVLRLFLLSSHYRSPLDFSDQALIEARQGLERLYRALEAALEKDQPPANQTLASPQAKEWQEQIGQAVEDFEQAMDDDFNTAAALGSLFSLARITNKLAQEPVHPERDALLGLCAARLKQLGGRLGILQGEPKEFFQGKVYEHIASGGVKTSGAAGHEYVPAALSEDEIEKQIEERTQARKAKDFARADAIRDELMEKGVLLEDTPQGTKWRFKA
ncbi:MAG: cysteine--tRNA ligase [Desulfarculaceae bacterium]|jgi:cysteinyl-tRNA synthetase